MNEKLNIDWRAKTVQAELRAIEFEEDGQFFMYIPSLELSSYGDTQKEVRELMDFSVREMFRQLFENGTKEGQAILKKWGFHKDKFFQRRYEVDRAWGTEDVAREMGIRNPKHVRQTPLYAQV